MTSTLSTKICESCKARYADYEVSYYGGSKYAFCRNCNDNQLVSPDYGKRKASLHPLRHPSNNLEKATTETEKCYCCDLYYNKGCGRWISFECTHSFWFCLNCSELRRYCQKDGEPVDARGLANFF